MKLFGPMVDFLTGPSCMKSAMLKLNNSVSRSFVRPLSLGNMPHQYELYAAACVPSLENMYIIIVYT